jgi:hypothetical protein
MDRQARDEEGRATSPARRAPNDLAKAKAHRRCGAVHSGASKRHRLMISPDAREVRLAYPLNGGIPNFP